jgi:flagella basal body P-ring formation protein FlgA
MTSFASLFLLAQLGAAASPAPPAALASRVHEAVAAQWQLPASAVELAWSSALSWRAEDADAPFRLGAVGHDGWAALTIAPRGAAPRALRVRVGTVAPVAVAARPLAAGRLLSAEDMRWEQQVMWGAPVPASSRVAEGWEVRRALATGEPLRGVAVAPPPGVARGATLRVVWARNGVAIEMEAVALTAARVGETVQAKTATGRISARMTAPGEARIEGGGA